MSSAGTAQEKPNVVLILSDDHAWPFYGFMGHEFVRTPHLDALAARGVVFPFGYVTEAHCTYSHWSILTGLNLRDIVNKKDIGSRLPVIPKVLEGLGYETIGMGKWWLGEPGKYFTYNRRARNTPEYKHFAREERRMLEEFQRQTDDELMKAPEKGLNPFLVMLRELERQPGKKKPWFYFCAPNVPHHPFEGAPQRFKDIYRPDLPIDPDKEHLAIGLNSARGYFANISWLDETVGKLMWCLEKKCLLDDTLVVMLSDNGAAIDRSKGKFAESGIRTPIVVSYPRLIKQRGRRDDLVGSIDVFRTILDFVPVSDEDAKKAVDSGVPWRDAASLKNLVTVEPFDGGWQPSWRRFVIFGNPTDSNDRSVRDREYKLYKGKNQKDRRLFRIADNGHGSGDPYESPESNLLDKTGVPKDAEAAAVLRRLEPILDAWWDEAYELLERRVVEAYPLAKAARA